MSKLHTPTCAHTCDRLGVCAALADCRDRPWHPVITKSNAHPESIQVEDDWAEGARDIAYALALVLLVGTILVLAFIYALTLGWLGVQL